MEELLTELIKRGWKPFGFYDRMYLSDESSYQYHKVEGIRSYFFVKGNGVGDNFILRELVSKESELWQFVCKNNMIKGRIKIEDYPAPRENKKIPTYKEWTKQQRGEGKQGDCVGAYSIDNYEYRLIESSLLDESELEKFLLDNININDN